MKGEAMKSHVMVAMKGRSVLPNQPEHTIHHSCETPSSTIRLLARFLRIGFLFRPIAALVVVVACVAVIGCGKKLGPTQPDHGPLHIAPASRFATAGVAPTP